MKESIEPYLRNDGARMVSFAENFVKSERANVDRRILLAQIVPFFFLGGLLILMFFVAAWLTRNLLLTLNRFMAYT